MEQLLRDLTKVEGMTWVVGSGKLVSENASRGIKEPEFTDRWANVEAENWHFHLRLGTVSEVQIIEDESDSGVPLSYYVRFVGPEDETLLRCYFPSPDRDGDGRLAESQTQGLKLFEEFRDRHAGRQRVTAVKRRRPATG